MAVSGTTAFSLDFTDALEEAADRAGVDIRGGDEYRKATRATNLLLVDMANRGLNLFSIDQGSVPIISGTGSYTLPADTVDLINHMHRDSDGRDQRLERMGVGSYANLFDKTLPGRPTRIYVERLTAAPIVHLWPIPDEDATLIYWRMRRLYEVTSPEHTFDLPFRFWPAIVAGLAYFIALQHPKEVPPDRAAGLKALFEEALNLAQDEDRGRESFFLRIRPGR